jgi:hypothetical protein
MRYSLLRAYVRLGGHPARVTANVGMRDGVVWSKGFHVWVETYGHPVGWSGNWHSEFTLIASAYSVSRFDRGFGGLIVPQLILHPYYLIGRLVAARSALQDGQLLPPMPHRQMFNA